MAAYMIFTRERTKDQGEMDIYNAGAVATLDGREFKPLAFYGAYEVLEGDAMEGAVVLEFPSVAEAKDWYHSAAYQQLVAHRHAGADYRVFVIEGAG